MLFNSYEFIYIFLPLVIIGYYCIGGWSSRLGMMWLILSSMVFYAWWDYKFLSLLFISIGCNYYISSVLMQFSKKNNYKLYLLWFGVLVNLLLLGYFKYYNFFISNLNVIFDLNLYRDEITLPLAISFYTFQQIAFLVDSYRKQVSDCSFIHYFLFVTFFPQLIAGPIVHHKDMIPQFCDIKKVVFSNINMSIGTSIFIIGLFKKVILADGLAENADLVFDNASKGIGPDCIHAWMGSIAYSLQIYFDFSGYSDMAIGIARMFGIILPINFNSPYKAYSIISFWTRWHITLSQFMRDYVYIPLGGNRHGKIIQIFSIGIAMFLAGLWHGAGWSFIIWGLLHGSFIIANHLWRSGSIYLMHKKTANGSFSKVIYRLITLMCILFSWVIFRANDLDSAIIIMSSMLDFKSLNLIQLSTFCVNNFNEILIIIMLLLFVLYCPNTCDIFKNFMPALGYRENKAFYPKVLFWKPTYMYSIGLGLIGLISILHMQRIKEFIYYSF